MNTEIYFITDLGLLLFLWRHRNSVLYVNGQEEPGSNVSNDVKTRIGSRVWDNGDKLMANCGEDK